MQGQLPQSPRQPDYGGLYLLRSGDEFDHLLQSASPMLIQSNLDHLRRSVVDEDRALVIVGEFQQFLTKVVAKGVCCTRINWVRGEWR